VIAIQIRDHDPWSVSGSLVVSIHLLPEGRLSVFPIHDSNVRPHVLSEPPHHGLVGDSLHGSLDDDRHLSISKE
jgi:hypothetical protein